MLQFLFLVWESLLFAVRALRENLLRTTLSLLGVTVGIFTITGVLTFVDALEVGIKQSLSFIGDKVIYIEKWPWSFTANYPWWKYANRPHVSREEFKFLEENLTLKTAISIFAIKGNLTIKHQNNSISGVATMGISYNHYQVADIRVDEGRYFNEREIEGGAQVALIGKDIAETLFGTISPIGKEIKINNRKFKVVGALEKQGSNLLDAPSNDQLCLIPYTCLTKMFVDKGLFGLNPKIAVKGHEEDKGLEELEGEITGFLRGFRGLKPIEDNNFALNRPEMFASFLESLIGVLQIAGWIIGSFSILVGGFGIANIMFVSVKERTSIIGIQKALGAKNYFILFQFLFESVFLSVIGGLAGLVLVSLLSFLSTDSFVISLNINNIIIGIIVSGIIGIISGIVPAISAAGLDPVEAIRSK